MSIFNKRNALIGFLTLKAASRRNILRRKQSKRSTWKIATLVVLGLFSLGLLAVLGAVALRRQREPEHIEGYAVAEEDHSPIPSAFAETTPEPFAASA